MSAKDAIKAREDARKKPRPAPKPKKSGKAPLEPPVVALPVEITEVPEGPDGEP